MTTATASRKDDRNNGVKVQGNGRPSLRAKSLNGLDGQHRADPPEKAPDDLTASTIDLTPDTRPPATADDARAFLNWLPEDLCLWAGSKDLLATFEDWLVDEEIRPGETIEVILPDAADSEQPAPETQFVPAVELTREIMWECFTSVSMGMVCLLPDLLAETRARCIADEDVRKFIAYDELEIMHGGGKSDSYCCMRTEKGVPYIECLTGSSGYLASSNELFAEIDAA